MNWGGVAGFLEMGGYAFYVWGAYLVTTALIAAEVVFLRARRRRAAQDVARRARSGTVEGQQHETAP
jgi:heme exporter protein D